jgi:hypothetical protein
MDDQQDVDDVDVLDGAQHEHVDEVAAAADGAVADAAVVDGAVVDAAVVDAGAYVPEITAASFAQHAQFATVELFRRTVEQFAAESNFSVNFRHSQARKRVSAECSRAGTTKTQRTGSEVQVSDQRSVQLQGHASGLSWLTVTTTIMTMTMAVILTSPTRSMTMGSG